MRVWLTILMLVIGAYQHAQAADVLELQSRDLMPVILMQGQDIVACGVSASFGDAPNTFDTELAIRKAPSGVRLQLQLRGPGPIADFRLHAATANPDPFAASELRMKDGAAVREVDASSPEIAQFLRDFFVRGQGIAVRLTDERSFDLGIPGPIPNSVRAAYLGCAGDFYR